MTLDRAGDALWFAGAFVLLGSALVARHRRQPQHRMVPMVLTWIAIFALLFAIAHWIDGRKEAPALQPISTIILHNVYYRTLIYWLAPGTGANPALSPDHRSSGPDMLGSSAGHL